MKELIFNYLANYGYISLYGCFFIELLGAPMPGETIMLGIGYMVYLGQMSWGLSILAVWAGTSSGALAAFWLGLKIGSPLLHKYGRYFGLTPERFARAENWLAVYGRKIIVVSYFIPGVRHITPYACGILEIPWHLFAVNALTGAFLYAAGFISLGRFLGPEDVMLFEAMAKHTTAIGGAVLIALAIYFYRQYRCSRDS